MKTVFLSFAEQDLEEIIAYIAADDVAAALRVLDEIEREIQRLRDHPFLGQKSTIPALSNRNFRHLLVLRWLVFYKIEDETVFIHRILSDESDYDRHITDTPTVS